jgi:hypothetical protein
MPTPHRPRSRRPPAARAERICVQSAQRGEPSSRSAVIGEACEMRWSLEEPKLLPSTATALAWLRLAPGSIRNQLIRTAGRGSRAVRSLRILPREATFPSDPVPFHSFRFPVFAFRFSHPQWSSLHHGLPGKPVIAINSHSRPRTRRSKKQTGPPPCPLLAVRLGYLSYLQALARRCSLSRIIPLRSAAGRISNGPAFTPGCFDINWMAWFRSRASSTRMPPICSFVSA